MKLSPVLLAASLVASPAFAAEEEAFSHALSLVQMFIHSAAQSSDPNASLRLMDDVLSGRNPEANRALSGLLEGATTDLSPEAKDRVASIGRDLAAIARRESATPRLGAGTTGDVDRALQARKDLTAMGLRYYDERQFADAVKRGDQLAVELFVAGKGLSPEVVSRNLPRAR